MSFVAFAILALLVVGSAAGVLLKRNPIHAALFLVVNLASVAGLFLTLRAEFLAAAQVIVYAGAIAVLFVFAIMVLIPGKEETGPDPLRAQRIMAVPLVAIFLVLVALALRSTMLRGPGRDVPVAGGVQALGRLLFTDYLFPFEVTSVLLLVAIVGVIALAKRRVGSE
ncbi:MAG TPA: NADH-quinone oxidoreductase subunit J [Methylomirabilota bacterium]|jgi:NADH-quinone oxidoreductase subunit J|nr:NADH-quinone oxidoreductase subunit J [Methylomirabilota bacterium]